MSDGYTKPIYGWDAHYVGVGGFPAAVKLIAVDEAHARKQFASHYPGRKITKLTNTGPAKL